MSDVERFYYAIQKSQSGNLAWGELNGRDQGIFVQAINAILHITNLKYTSSEQGK